MKAINFTYASLFIRCMSFVCIAPANAQQVLFDFDSAPLYSNFPMSQTVNGITAQFTATGQGYSIQEANVLGFTPQGFSGHIIYPNSINLADLLIKFDTKLTDFSIMYACQELGCDDAATMRVTAYLSGSFVGTNTKTAANPGTWPVDTLSCSFTGGFDSVVVHYASPPPTCQDYGTIFVADNMRVTPYGALPVKLVYFICNSKGNEAILQWESAEEINLNNYIVQYAADGISFRDITKINAAGSNHQYSFIQQDVNGTAYYRLKISDNDGAYQYSAIKKIMFNGKTGFSIVPNPSDDYIQVYGDDATNAKTIQIFSVEGISLKTVKNYSSGQKINVSDLSKGIYIVKVFSSKNDVLFEKFFLKK